MECPKCKVEIGRSTYCGCGWSKKFVEPSGQYNPLFPCAHLVCGENAYVKVLTPTGWATFCDHHYSAHFLDKAEKTCKLLNLNSVKEKREWVNKRMKFLYAKLAANKALREPGEDEDFVYKT